MKQALNDNFDDDTFAILAAPTARVVKRLELTEQQEVDRDGDTHTGRADEKDSSSDGSNITKRRAAAR
jgi:hypothetical protein